MLKIRLYFFGTIGSLYSFRLMSLMVFMQVGLCLSGLVIIFKISLYLYLFIYLFIYYQIIQGLQGLTRNKWQWWWTFDNWSQQIAQLIEVDPIKNKNNNKHHCITHIEKTS